MTDGTGINIGVFSDEYGQAVIDLIVTIQQQEFGLPITAADQPDLADIPGFYRTGLGNFWVALQGNRVAGTVALLDIGDHQAALRKMFVHPDFRGREKGTAKGLLAALLAWAGQKGIQKIYLGTTPKFLAAHRFYEKNGFEETGKQDLPASFPIMTVDTKFYCYEIRS